MYPRNSGLAVHRYLSGSNVCAEGSKRFKDGPQRIRTAYAAPSVGSASPTISDVSGYPPERSVYDVVAVSLFPGAWTVPAHSLFTWPSTQGVCCVGNWNHDHGVVLT